MELLNPWGLLALLAVPALIALYILKQKHKEIKVPSIFLWQQSQSMMQASTPWQKLKKNLLFILQLLMIIILAFAISRPAFASENIFDETVIIVDTSASMNAKDSEGTTRFDYAMSQVNEMASNLARGKKMTVIFAGDSVFPAISHSDNKLEIKRAISTEKCGYGGSDMENAILLARSLNETSGKSQIVIFTDTDIASADSEDIEVINISVGHENCAIMNMSCMYENGSFTLLSTVKTFGEAEKELTLELFSGEKLIDAQRVTVTPGQAFGVYWKNIDSSYKSATVKIKEDDILTEDNSMSIPLVKSETRKILVVSEQSFFFEKIFNALGGFELYKMTPATYTDEDAAGYDLYIFDGFVPENIPSGGAIWMFNPENSALGFTVGDTIAGAYLSPAETAAGKEICEYLNLSEVAVSKFRDMDFGSGWNTAALCGLLPVIAIKTADDGQRFVVVAFDIHNSNLPLRKEFPILIQNMISYSIPGMTEGNGIYQVGYSLEVKALAYSTEIRTVTPEGEEILLAPPFPSKKITLSLPGMYKILQKTEKIIDGEMKETIVEGYVTAVIPESESRMDGMVVSSDQIGEIKGLKGQMEIWPYLLIAIMLLMMAEWVVYFREY